MAPPVIKAVDTDLIPSDSEDEDFYVSNNEASDGGSDSEDSEREQDTHNKRVKLDVAPEEPV